MKEKHADQEVLCLFCLENQTHPKLARGETYSCGYKPYRCELCKYSTTTKGNLSIHMQSDKHLHALQEIPQSLAAAAVAATNFQLHTRTDKHLQRVQMINHLREGITGLFGQSEQFARLGTLKSAVQVRCQECEEILSCIPTLREHCQSYSHQIRMIGSGRCLQNEIENVLESFLSELSIICGICDWEMNGNEKIISLAFEHANTHSKQFIEITKQNDSNKGKQTF
uniref:C2H2-type domain-containing protein n=2 Tax=Meloidogyne incognita group TaxID=654580 RepID=A0A915MNS9_MELJA